MTKQLLRYGLTTALRPFDVPASWTGTQRIETTLAEHTNHSTLHDVRADTLARVHTGHTPLTTYHAGSGEHHLTRTITGSVAARTTIVVEAGAHVTITETLEGTGNLALSVLVMLGRDATCTYRLVQDLAPGSIALLAHEAQVSHATYEWLLVSLGGEHVQTHVTTYAGERADTKTRGVIIASGTQQIDSFATTVNDGPNSVSDMLVRAVVDDKARAVLHGLITITPNAPECDSYQKAEAILLSDDAGADAIPNLEIGNHRVRCSHGATIGKLDAEKLFYLTSRGVSEADAKRAITEGFVSSLLTPELAERALAKLERRTP